MACRISILCRSGFTLVELLLVLLIAGILLGSAVPSLKGFASGRALETGARTTASACNYARSVAVATGLRTRLWIDREQGRLSILVEEDPLGSPSEFTPREWPMGIRSDLPEQVQVEQIHYPEHRLMDEEDSEEAGEDSIEYQTRSEALEERESILVFQPNGSTRDTFIYLSGDRTIGPSSNPASDINDERGKIRTVAIVGAIGTSVVVNGYTNDIFTLYEDQELR